ncbi:hypothetical protein [Cryobacterium sp. Y57]|uniref:hypothetical protein n=1 Tax=Cryobacterium sp. Y57 TaxID=2048287 RepID=UPI0018EB05F7
MAVVDNVVQKIRPERFYGERWAVAAARGTPAGIRSHRCKAVGNALRGGLKLNINDCRILQVVPL